MSSITRMVSMMRYVRRVVIKECANYQRLQDSLHHKKHRQHN